MNITDQEVDAGSKHPYDDDETESLGDADVIVALNDVQQLQYLGCFQQVDQTQEPQTCKQQQAGRRPGSRRCNLCSPARKLSTP